MVELSAELKQTGSSSSKENYTELIKKHLVYYDRTQDSLNSWKLSAQNNYHLHLSRLLEQTRGRCLEEFEAGLFGVQSAALIETILSLHDTQFSSWEAQPRAAVFWVDLLHRIYQREDLYVSNLLMGNCVKKLLRTLQRLCQTQKRMLLDNGFVHDFYLLMLRQHTLTHLYIGKHV